MGKLLHPYNLLVKMNPAVYLVNSNDLFQVLSALCPHLMELGEGLAFSTWRFHVYKHLFEYSLTRLSTLINLHFVHMIVDPSD